MPLNLNDLLKKAEKKGFTQQNTSSSPTQLLRPWQQESILYAPDNQKLEPNLSQSEVKVEPPILPISEEDASQNKLEPNLSQSRVKGKSNLGQVKPNLSQSEVKVETNVEPKPKPKLSQKSSATPRNNLSQSEVKVEPNREFSLLVGLQKQITIFLFEECQLALAEETPGLTIDYIGMNCKTTKSAARKALQRLEKKEIIIRSDFKNGRAGWTRYKLPNVIYQEIHRLKSLNKLEPILSQVRFVR